MDLVSVIVPVYNVEKYLEKCINSILAQTYIAIEIILVDDGSTDTSGLICDQYATKDERVIVVHKSNGGLSDARNKGLEVCSGKYLTFVDSDDYITQDYVAYLKEMLDSEDADISVVDFTHIESQLKTKDKAIVKKYAQEEMISALLYQEISTSANAKMYKRELFDNICFPEGKLYEDIISTYCLFKNANRLVYSPIKKYYYYVRDNSIVRSSFNSKKMDYIDNCIFVLNDVSVEFPELIAAAESRLLWADIHIWVNIDEPKKYDLEFKRAKKLIKKYRGTVLRNPMVRNKNKFVILLTFFGWAITRKVYLKTKH